MPHDDPHVRLRKKLDGLPVGYPSGEAGMKLLRRLFEPEEALVALGMDWHFRSSAEIALELGRQGVDPFAGDDGPRRAEPAVGDGGLASRKGLPSARPAGADRLVTALDAMAAKGAILRRAKEGHYALQPFVVGMYELQIGRLSRDLVDEAADFLYKGYGLELLTTGEAQSRIIPIGAAIKPEHRVASYEEFRSLIKAAEGRIAVLPCVCRTGADLVGHHCEATDRRELCIVFRDYADTVVREGWGRAIGVDEALSIAEANEAEGLVMRPSNEQQPQFLCGCCGDCCGLFAVVKAMKRPADFVSSNFRAVVDREACTGCAACSRRCPMGAIEMVLPEGKGRQGAAESAASAADRAAGGAGAASSSTARVEGRAAVPKSGLVRKGRGVARIDYARCVGCGVCVGACKFGAVALERKDDRVPPRDTVALLERLAATRPGNFRKLATGVKGLLGLPLSPWRR